MQPAISGDFLFPKAMDSKVAPTSIKESFFNGLYINDCVAFFCFQEQHRTHYLSFYSQQSPN